MSVSNYLSGAVLILALFNLAIAYWLVRRSPELRRVPDNAPMGSSLILYVATITWTLGIAMSVHQLLFSLLDWACGYAPRSGAELMCDTRRVIRRPEIYEPQFGKSWFGERGSVLLRDLMFVGEVLLVVYLLISQAQAEWAMFCVVYLMCVKLCFLLRAIVSHAGAGGEVWNKSRAVLVAGINYVFFLVAFAFIYTRIALNGQEFSGPCLNDPCTALYFSAITMATIGYGEIHPVTGLSRGIVAVQGLIGLFLIVVVVQTYMTVLLEGRESASRTRQ